MAIASKDGLLDSPRHRVLNFFDRSKIANVDERKEAITVQSLLDMTSGIEWTEPLDGRPDSVIEMERSPDWVKFILDRPMSSAPGDTFNYNSGNPHLLSAILTKLTGMNALEYAKTKLFGPLGINDLYWRQDPQGISRRIRTVLAGSRYGEDRLSIPAQRHVGRSGTASARLDR
ncbi:MAG TPA: serine hydrolase domain-containing protein [Candidatus Acidoferrum sp.]